MNKKSMKQRGTIFSSSVQSESSKEERAKKRRQVEEMMRALESDNNDNSSFQKVDFSIKDSSNVEKNGNLDPNSLAETFINECEKDLKKLKRMKSEAMVTIEGAHCALLETVEVDIDANDAYTSLSKMAFIEI